MDTHPADLACHTSMSSVINPSLFPSTPSTPRFYNKLGSSTTDTHTPLMLPPPAPLLSPPPPRRFYNKLGGMTGTARSAAAEFYEIYGLKVVPVPTNRPPARTDLPPRMYFTEEDKLAYITAAVEHCWASHRPLLIGTTSVNESEKVGRGRGGRRAGGGVGHGQVDSSRVGEGWVKGFGGGNSQGRCSSAHARPPPPPLLGSAGSQTLRFQLPPASTAIPSPTPSPPAPSPLLHPFTFPISFPSQQPPPPPRC
jgi:hypothetical protein